MRFEMHSDIEPSNRSQSPLSEESLPLRESLDLPELYETQESPEYPSLPRDYNLHTLGIDSDVQRFREIVKGRIRDDLGKYMTSDELISRKNGDTIRVPIPHITPPHFRHSSGEGGEGVGQGDGEVGDSIGKPGQGEEPGPGAGEDPGDHMLEEEMTLEELAELMGEMLELPRIEPKGDKTIETIAGKYNTISRQGPGSLRHAKRTLKQALLREIASGEYDPDDPKITPIREDFRYKAYTPEPKPESNAAIIYVMDVSGSMTGGQKEIARITSFWIDVWLRSQYDGVERIFIIHDSDAKEVDEETFFRTNATGGTKISSAYKEVEKVLQRFPPEHWNLYLFQFSDGDNWGTEDNATCLRMLKEKLLPQFNQVAYGQIAAQNSWSGPKDTTNGFYEVLDRAFKSDDKMVLAGILNNKDIPGAIKKFFGKGQ
jgi:uncharacterized protein